VGNSIEKERAKEKKPGKSGLESIFLLNQTEFQHAKCKQRV
jgi:hypothetical protein